MYYVMSDIHSCYNEYLAAPEQNHHIAIDCGCVYGGRLGVYCLDTGETWYVEAKK